MHYLELLRRLHDELQPAGYLEIGVDTGDALQLSRARSVAIGPAPKPRPESLLGKPGLLLYVGESDDYFREHERETMLRDAPLDLAFIDGLHEFTQVVRDLENIERWGHANTVVAIHDVLPRTAWEAAHDFHDGLWTGDVWRIVPFLRERRPDLRHWLTRAEPTGMLIVTGFDPAHAGMAALADAADAAFPAAGPEYNSLVDAYIAAANAEPAEAVIRALGLGRRLERDWEYRTQFGMRLVTESSWRPLLEAAAELPHTSQHRDGLRACLRLIDAHWLPEGVREKAYGLLTAYAEPLATLWPGASWQALALPDDPTPTVRSPGPASAPDGLVVATRTTTDGEEPAWTLLNLDREMVVRDATRLADETRADAPVAAAVSSIEELHPVFHDGRLHALVTLCDRNPRGVAQTGLATVQDGALRGLRFLSDPANGRHERHWAPFLAEGDLHVVSWWEPTETLRLDVESGKTQRVALRPAPRLAERFTGATAGVEVPGGRLFLVNEPAGANGETPETYARFVFMRSDFVVTAVSPHFWVKARGEDCVSGLTKDDDHLIFGCTSRDKQILLAQAPLDDVLASLLRVESAGFSGP